MKHYILVLSMIITVGAVSQTPQFAVVRPDGTTYICPGFDSAYNKASDDDIIYMPGVQIDGDKTVSKRLTLIGTGHYLDSTIYTGKTIFTGYLSLEKKCTFEGFECTNIYITNNNLNGSSFIRIKANNLDLLTTNNNFIDGSIIYSIYGSNCGTSSSNNFIKNSIISQTSFIINSNFKNCTFLAYPQGNLETTNCLYTNCIFRGNFSFGQALCYSPVINTVNNSLYTAFIYANPPIGQNNIQNNEPDTIFINAPAFYPFNYSYNYHLKPNSPYLTVGDDGGQIGIYGGNGPYKEGAVPSNPHIYFKQVSNQTTTNGQLPVQFKVRTNN